MAKGSDTKEIIVILLLLLVAGLLFYLAFLSPAACAGCNAKVEFVFSPEAQDEVVSFIRSAQKTIDIEMYVLTSEDVIYELGEAEKRGVQVRVIMEPRVEDSRKTKTFAILRELGADVRWASFGYKLTHSKFIIIDGKKALVGSINLSESALRKNREAAVLVEGEEVKRLAAIFEEDWEKATFVGENES
ncbi:MAG: phospholipase D-like domain-containing protein [Candidatus Micrarchaeota archaeon]|nr:phospholipase D-like domain-containing protein [Candidatus Micrarchaeota archaeon]